MSSLQRNHGVDRVCLASYPPGVPAEIDAERYRSLLEVFDESVARHGERPAFANLGTTLSYRQLEERSRDFAAFLQNELRLGKGARLAIMMPNLLQYPTVLFGALRAGLIQPPTSARCMLPVIRATYSVRG